MANNSESTNTTQINTQEDGGRPVESDKVDTGLDLRRPVEPNYSAERIPFQEDFNSKQIIVSPNYLRARRDINLNSSRGTAGAVFFRVVTFADTDATPSVMNANVFITTGTTAITMFDDGTAGQCIIVNATGNITITDGTNLQLAGNANFAMTSNDTLTLMMFVQGTWLETARSVN